VEFDVPVTYPQTAPEIALPELDGKTAKMYRGGKICMTDHFKVKTKLHFLIKYLIFSNVVQYLN